MSSVIFTKAPTNVFGAFQEGLSKGPEPVVANAPAGANDTVALLRALQTLAEQPNWTQPFSAFTATLGADPATNLATAATLMKNNWIKLDDGYVSLTGDGHNIVETFKASSSAS